MVDLLKVMKTKFTSIFGPLSPVYIILYVYVYYNCRDVHLSRPGRGNTLYTLCAV